MAEGSLGMLKKYPVSPSRSRYVTVTAILNIKPSTSKALIEQQKQSTTEEERKENMGRVRTINI